MQQCHPRGLSRAGCQPRARFLHGRIFWPGYSSRITISSPCHPSRIGGEKVILLSASAWGFITAATPLLAHLGSAQLVFMTFSRILTGLLQGKGTAAGVQPSAPGTLASVRARANTRVFMRQGHCTHVCALCVACLKSEQASECLSAVTERVSGSSNPAGGQLVPGRVAGERSPLPAARARCSSLGRPVRASEPGHFVFLETLHSLACSDVTYPPCRKATPGTQMAARLLCANLQHLVADGHIGDARFPSTSTPVLWGC